MRFAQGLASVGLAAVGIWMLVLVGDPVAAATSGAAFALLCVAWVVRPKAPHSTDDPGDAGGELASPDPTGPGKVG